MCKPKVGLFVLFGILFISPNWVLSGTGPSPARSNKGKPSENINSQKQTMPIQNHVNPNLSDTTSSETMRDPEDLSTENRIVLVYDFPEPTVEKSGQYDELHIEGLVRLKRPGAPLVPLRPISVLLPLGKQVAEFNVVPLAVTELDGTYKLQPGQGAFIRTEPKRQYTTPDPEIYSKNEWWPGVYHQSFTQQSQRGYQVLSVNLLPVQYAPLSGRVSYATKLRVEVSLSDSTTMPTVRPTKALTKKLKRSLDNPLVLATYSENALLQHQAVHLQIKTKTGKATEADSLSTARVVKTHDGYFQHIRAPRGTYFEVRGTTITNDSPEEIAKTFLLQNLSRFAASDSLFDFTQIRATKIDSPTENKRTYVRYQQTYGGLDVFAAQLIVQVGTDGGVISVASDIMTDPGPLRENKASLEPHIDAQTAQDIAIKWMASQRADLKFEASDTKLMVFSPAVVGQKGQPRLVWQTTVGNTGRLIAQQLILVDAIEGEVAFHYSLICDALYREIYDGGSPGQPLVRSEGDPPTGVPDIDNAYDYLGDVHNFYATEHGRDGYDDAGTLIKTYVLNDFDNAFWVTSRIYLGVGNAIDDIVGHEFTHGVTQTESQLIYQNESGAINESFSDMWGEWVDQTNQAGDDSPEVKWRLFEDWDCWGDAAWGQYPDCRVWRRMDNPTQVRTDSSYGVDFGDLRQPDRYFSPYYYLGTHDSGGAHHNNGVGNKLAYLLTDGDTFNGYTIDGMGIQTAAALFYDCQVNGLSSGSDYAALGNALINAAISLGLSQNEIDNVKRACRAVEIYYEPQGELSAEYLVITNNALADIDNIPDPDYSFQALCESKRARGLTTTIVTTEWIYANYTGEDQPAMIRNFLINAFQEWGTKYVLLGGNKDVIPVRMFYSGEDIPCDFYYGAVDPPECTFNYDQDSRYGEPTDGINGGEVDLLADLYVGRAAVVDAAEVVNFVQKTLTYETTNDSYLNAAFFGGGFLGFGGIQEFTKPFSELMQFGSSLYNFVTVGLENSSLVGLRDFTVSTLYDEDTYNEQHDPDFDHQGHVTWNPATDAWSAPYDLVPILNGEGDATTPQIMYIADHGWIDQGMVRMFTGDTVSDPELHSSLNELTNTNYFFFYDDSCWLGSLEHQSSERCFGEIITTMEHGAYACIVNSRSGWGSQGDDLDSPSTHLTREFFDAVFGEGILKLGEANEDARADSRYAIDEWGLRYVYYELILFGDPELSMRVVLDEPVCNTRTDNCFETIQGAIDDPNTNNGDILVLQPTTYRGEGNRDLDFAGKAITITSIDPTDPAIVAATVIDCDGSRAEPHRGFIFNSGEGPDSVVDGITITNGYGNLQDGYYAGGAVFCRNSSPTIRRCVLTGNVNDVVNNDVDAGAIACYTNSAPLILNCVITNNAAYYSGGIDCWNSSPTIKNCQITDNIAVYGAGIYFYEYGNAAVTNCTISNNHGNTYGGGQLCWNSSPTLTNTVLWGNTAGQLNPQSALEDLASNPCFSYCDIEGSLAGGQWNSELGVDSGNNIDADPLFLDSAQGNYHIDTLSPCINSGDPAYVPDIGETDIDGEYRVLGNAIDIGADEGIPPCISVDVNCDEIINRGDTLTVRDPGNWNLPCSQAANPRADVNRDGQVDENDRLAILQSGLWLTNTGHCSCPETTCP